MVPRVLFLLQVLVLCVTPAHAAGTNWQPASCVTTPEQGITFLLNQHQKPAQKTQPSDWGPPTPQGIEFHGSSVVTVTDIPPHTTILDLKIEKTFVSGEYWGNHFMIYCYPAPNKLGTVVSPPRFRTRDGCPEKTTKQTAAQMIVDVLGPHRLNPALKPENVWFPNHDGSWRYLGPPLIKRPVPLRTYLYAEASRTTFLPHDYVDGVIDKLTLFCTPAVTALSSPSS